MEISNHDRMEVLMWNIKFIVFKNYQNIDQLFKKFEIETLDRYKFMKLMKFVDQKVTNIQVNQLFKFIVKENKDYISKQQLLNCLYLIDIQNNPYQSKSKLSTSSVQQEKYLAILLDAKKHIQNQNLPIKYIMNIFDQDVDGYLNQNELIGFLKNINVKVDNGMIKYIMGKENKVEINKFIKMMDLEAYSYIKPKHRQQLKKPFIRKPIFKKKPKVNPVSFPLYFPQNPSSYLQQQYNKHFSSKQKTHFIDNDFPPNQKSLYHTRKFKQKWGKSQWKRAGSFMNKICMFTIAKSVFDRSRIGIGQLIQQKDIMQGLLGDCYLLSALASITSKFPQLIHNLFTIKQQNDQGFYCVKLFVFGQWKQITLDDYFPIKNDSPLFSKAVNNQIWVMLLEKACAKVFGSYQNIESGIASEGLSLFSGATNQYITDKDKNYLSQVTSALDTGHIVTCGSSKYLQSLSLQASQKLGLIRKHAYSLTKIKYIKHNGNNKYPLFKIKNPWGKNAWTGDWSFNSQKWTKQTRIQCKFQKNPNDGTFYMCIQDFIKYYGYSTISYINQSYKHSSQQQISCKSNTYYFKLLIIKQGSYTISVYQQPQRLHKNQPYKYEYSKVRMSLVKIQKYMKWVDGANKADYQVSVNLTMTGEYLIGVKVFWNHDNEDKFVLTSYGVEHVKIIPLGKQPGTLDNIIKAYAGYNQKFIKQKCSLYKNTNIKKHFEANLHIGLGYNMIINDDNKTLDTKINLSGSYGIKLRKNYTMNLVVQPNTFSIVPFTIDSTGYSYSISQSYHVK